MNNQTILIVNDAPDQLELSSFPLREAGYRVLTAADGLEGLRIARLELPDLIISNVIMPEMDGFELCREIRADEKLTLTPFLLVSALRQDIESAVEGLKTGADDYLEIPYEPMRLVAKAVQLIERKHSIEALRLKESRFRTIIENVTDVISILKPDGTITYESSSLESTLGYKPEELIGHNIFDFIHPDDARKVTEYFEFAVSGVESASPVEYRFRHKNGSWRILESTGKPFDDPDSGRAAVINSRDITERKKAEEALRTSDQRYHSFIEQSTEGIWRVEFNAPIPTDVPIEKQIELICQYGYYAECNDAMARMYKLGSAKDLTGKNIGEFLLLSDSSNIGFMRTFIENGYNLNNAESHELDAHGRDKYFLNNFVGIVDKGKLNCIWGMQRDITYQKYADTALRESQERLELAQQAAKIGSFEIDLETRTAVVSPEIQTLLDLSTPDSVLTMDRWSRVIHPEDQKKVEENIQEAIKSGKLDSEYRIVLNDGRLRWLFSNGKVFYDEGKPSRIVGFNMDVTERKQAEATLLFQKSLLEAQSEASLDGVLVVALTGEIISYNRRFAEMWEIADEVINTRSDDAFLDSIIDKFVDSQEFLETVSYLYENPFVKHQTEIALKDGRTFERYSAPVMDSEKTHFGRIWSFRDITKRKQVENNLLESERRFRQLIELSPDAIMVHCEGRIVFHNSACAELLGATDSSEINERMMLDILHPDYRDFVSERICRVVKGEDAHFAEEQYLRLDGTTVDVEVSGTPFIYNNIPSVLVVARDITERRKAEEAIRFQAHLLNTVEQAVIATDLNGIVIYWNQFAHKLYGWSAEEAIGCDLMKFITPKTGLEQGFEIMSQLSAGKSWSGEFLVQNKNGEIFPAQVMNSPIQDGSGNFVGIIGISFDISQRRAADEKIKVSEARLANAQRIAHIGNWDWDVRNDRLYWSDEVYIIFGLSKSESENVYEYFINGVHPKDRRMVQAAVDAALTGIPYNIEHRVVRPDGEERIVQEIGEMTFSESGEPLRMTGTIQDITERKRSEEALSESENHLRAIFNAEPECVKLLGLKGELLEMNPAGLAIVEADSLEQVLGKSVLNLVEPDYQKSFEALTESVLKGASGTLEFEIVGLKGTHRWLETHAVPLKNSAGKITSILAVTRDMTVRKESEKNLAEANQRAIREYEHLLERIAQLAESLGTARDLMTIYRALYAFTVISTPCTGFFISLYDAKRNVRIPAYVSCDGKEVDVSHLPPMEMSGSPNSRAISTGSIVIEDDFQAAIHDKPIINIGLEIHPDPPQSCLVIPMSVMGRIIGAVEVQSDVPAAYTKENTTALRLAANIVANAIENVQLLEQERLNAEHLRQSQKLESVGRLAGGIAHDFNNMLTAINGYSDLTLRRLSADDPLRRNVEEIKKAGERSASLTAQLLAFSRQQVLKTEVIEVNKIVTDTSAMLQRLIGEDIQLNISLDPKLGHIKADPGQLTQVIMNLAVNARDAMPDGGELTIETSNVYLDAEYALRHVPTQPGYYVMLAISDGGTGIDKENLLHVFEPFYTTKETGKGTGLGLAQVYGIVKQSEGYIWVYSEVGIGTTFKIYLPRVTETASLPAEHKTPEVLRIGTETILLVEDENIVRKMSRQMLEVCGYQVIEARNGVEAISICESQNPKIDLLLTDVVMPQMGGRELAERMLKIYPDIRLIYTSGYTDDAIIRRGMITEDTNFIQKPFTFEVLTKKVRESLDAPVNGSEPSKN